MSTTLIRYNSKLTQLRGHASFNIQMEKLKHTNYIYVYDFIFFVPENLFDSFIWTTGCSSDQISHVHKSE